MALPLDRTASTIPPPTRRSAGDLSHALAPRQPVPGRERAIEIKVFGSPLCPFTQAVLSVLGRTLRSAEGPDVPTRLVFRHAFEGVDTTLGALAATFCLAAEREDAHWEAVWWLARRGVRGLSEPGAFARSADLEPTAFRADLQRDCTARLAADRSEAAWLGVVQAPAVFVADVELAEVTAEGLVEALLDAWEGDHPAPNESGVRRR